MAGTLGATPAEAATKCEGGTGSGRCITVTKVKKHTKVVESVPLENRSSKKATLYCSFTKTISQSITASQSVSGSVKISVFKVVDLSTSIEVSRSLTQTATQATSAGGSVELDPHESVTCQRTYGYVSANVKQVDYTSKKSETKKYTVKVPVSLGVRIVD